MLCLWPQEGHMEVSVQAVEKLSHLNNGEISGVFCDDTGRVSLTQLRGAVVRPA